MAHQQACILRCLAITKAEKTYVTIRYTCTMNTSKQKNLVPSITAQKIFITLALLSFLGTVIGYLQVFEVYSQPLALSQFAIAMLGSLLVPFILVAIAVPLLWRRKAPMTWRIFEVIFYITIALLTTSLLTQIAYMASDFLRVSLDVSIGYMLPWTAALIFYVTLLIQQRRAGLRESISPLVQKIYVGLTVTGWTLITIETSYRILQQLPTNQNLSGFITTIAAMILLPLALFGIGYFIRSQPTRLSRMFQATFLATFGILIYTIIGISNFYIFDPNLGLINGDNWQLYSLGQPLLALVLFLVLVRFLRIESKSRSTAH